MNAPWWNAITAGLVAAGTAGPLFAQPGPPTPTPLPPKIEDWNPNVPYHEYLMGNRQARDLWRTAQHSPEKSKDLSFTLTVRRNSAEHSEYQKVRWTRVLHHDTHKHATRVEFLDQGDQPAEIWALTRQHRRFQILDFAEKTLVTMEEFKELGVWPAEAFCDPPYWWGWACVAEPSEFDHNFQFQPDQSVRDVTCRVISYGAPPALPNPAEAPAVQPPKDPRIIPFPHFSPRYGAAWIAPDGHAARVARTSWETRGGEILKDEVTYDVDDYKSDAGLSDGDLELHAPPGWSERSLRPKELDLWQIGGSGLPGFTLTDTAGAVVTYGALPDRTMLVFWTPWSEKTPALFAELKKLCETLEPAGISLTLVCIWAQDDASPAKALREHGWDGPSLLHGERLARRLDVSATPTILQTHPNREPTYVQLPLDEQAKSALLKPSGP